VIWPWLVLSLLLAAAAVWTLSLRRRAFDERAAAARARRGLAEMSWREVERVIGDYVRGRDFAVAETERAEPDGAADLLLTRLNEYYLVRSRHWRATTVGAEAVREFQRVMAARHAAGGFIVTSGSFSPEARELARERKIELIDGEQLVPVFAGRARVASS
jgi:restriction system protein